MNRLGWLCTNKQQTKNCKQLNLNTRRENTLWENTVWNVETPPDKIHRKSSREKRKKNLLLQLDAKIHLLVDGIFHLPARKNSATDR